MAALRSPPCLLHEFESRGEEACDVRTKRIYDEPAPGDGFRVLVDRLWPRGIRRDRAALDAWERELAPSPGLRKWFGHDPRRFAEFRRRYLAELRGRRVELDELRQLAGRRRVTLLYGARDPRINHALVLAEAIRRRGSPPRRVNPRIAARASTPARDSRAVSAPPAASRAGNSTGAPGRRRS